MAQVLAAELTLRNGQFALAVMRLADILEMPQITQQVRDEARLLIDTATMMHSRPVLALTTQLADHADVSRLPATPRYIYVVASSDFENTAGLRAGLRPPALPPLAAPGGATAELPAAPDDALVAAAIITPSPAAPSDGPADMPDDIQTDGGEDTPDDLLLLLFEDPGNLELNFALFQQQLSEDDLDGAVQQPGLGVDDDGVLRHLEGPEEVQRALGVAEGLEPVVDLVEEIHGVGGV